MPARQKPMMGVRPRLLLTSVMSVVCVSIVWAGENDAASQTQAVDKPAEFKRMGWNAKVYQLFMHPPVFHYAPMSSAAGYRYTIRWKDVKNAARSEQHSSQSPELDLARVWEKLPSSGPFEVVVEALDAEGNVLATTSSACRRKAPFKGPYRPARCGYDESATKAVQWVMQRKEKDLTHPFPGVLYSSYIRLLTTYARLHPTTELARQALGRANQYGKELLDGSTPADWVYANMPQSHSDPKVLQICRTAMAGDAYLDLFEVAKDEAYLAAAMRIADTLKKTQLPEGRWYFRVEPRTGKTLEDHTSDQAEAIGFMDRLIGRYGRRDLVRTRDRAVQWMLNNPCRTFQWQQQWDDVGTASPYANLSWFDTGLFIEHLLQNATPRNNYEKIASDLVRYVDDQFVEWEPVENFITPGVREQYLCYHVIDWHGAHYIRICLAVYAKTKDGIWLRKAQALADTLTAIQHPQGCYPTWMRHKPRPEHPLEVHEICYDDIWPNCTSYCAEMLLRLDEELKKQ
jgi:maltose/maltodextrin transport system substrate-binding protein